MSERRENARRISIGSSIVALSHPGGRSHNEDDFLILQKGEVLILAVADGLGGHQAGEIASGIAIETIEKAAQDLSSGIPDPEKVLEDMFQQVDAAIRARAYGSCEGMATTLVAALVLKGKAVIAYSGDSRAYLIRDRVVMKTRDHSAVQDLIDSGIISERDAHSHPLRHIVTGALGIEHRIDTLIIPIQKGDTLLLASDGLYEAIEEERLVALVRCEPFPSLASRLLDEVVDRSTDNVTFVLARI